MGKNRKHRLRNKKNPNKRTKEEWEQMKKDDPSLGTGYRLAPKTNENFEKYYQGIELIPEGEWENFLTVMRKPLPSTFRITGSRGQAQELLKIIKGQYLDKFISKDYSGLRLNPHSLAWYPDEMAWQLDFTKREIKQDSNLKSLHGFLVSETESGNISRQEAVSMLPPLLMDIEPHHKILDMCAAPGSKTAQLIEMLHKDDNIPVPDGFVVANDMDNKRCYLMTHQVKRIQSPNCIIINHDARILPNMRLSDDEDSDFIKYDRILCDVPCSGDGTMRKNPDIWSKWHVNGGYNLHRIQLKVFQRGLELLEVGGQLVYSTCSLNPVEDEAVIFSLIKQCAGAIELVDVSDKLPGLKYCKGTYTWKIMTKGGKWYNSPDEAPPDFRAAWDDTIYPPPESEAREAKLERCVRVLPHHQNTGAFFIAVIKKTKELPWLRDKSKGRYEPTLRKLDDGEQLLKEAGHMSFGVKGTSGQFIHARCNLCAKQLQSKHDYDAHIASKRHLEAQQKAEEGPAEEDTENQTAEAGKTTETNTTAAADTGEGKANGTETGEKDKAGEKTPEGMEVSSDVAEIEDAQDKEDGPPPAKKSRRDKKMAKINSGEVQVTFKGYKEDPFYFCGQDEPVWPKIKTYFDISDDLDLQQIMFRNMKRILYYVSKPVRNIVINNCDRVKFINLGVKCFTNAPSPLVPDCDFRLSQEGLLALQSYIRGRRIYLTKQDLITILSEENPYTVKLSSATQEEVFKLSAGSTLFIFKPTDSDPEPKVEIIFCGWRGKTSVRSFVGKDERAHYLRLCGVELSDIQEAKKAQKEEKKENEGGDENNKQKDSGDDQEMECQESAQADDKEKCEDAEKDSKQKGDGVNEETDNKDLDVKCADSKSADPGEENAGEKT